MDSYVLGQPVIIDASFAVDGTPTAPTTLTLSVQAADGTIVDYVYPASEIVSPSTGVYEGTITPDAEGLWRYRWVGEGVAPGAIEGEFVIASIFEPEPAPVPRTSMSTIVTRLRGMIGDNGTTQTFTDLELEEILDERRTDVFEAQLRAQPALTSLSLDFIAPRRWWEDSVVLTDASGVVITPDTSDLMAGRWSFDAGAADPVFVTGSYFDLYGSAAAALTEWAGRVAREFDFATDQQSFDRTGKREGLMAVAREYTRKAIQPGRRPAWRSVSW